VDISDRNRFFTFLAFLNHPSRREQCAILERRLALLESGRSFFRREGKSVVLAEEHDKFRKGMLHITRETSRVEKHWLRETLASLRD